MNNPMYPPHLQRLLDHCLDEFDGQILLNPKQVAKVRGTTEGNLSVERCKKQGPAFIKCGRSVRYNLYQLLDWLAEREAAA
nr:hypothetical protein 1 [Desulfobulbaceae bacterium]